MRVMRRSPVTLELEKLRRFRAQVSPDLTMKEDVTKLYRDFNRQQKAATSLDDIWREIAPAAFVDRASIKKISTGGILTIRTSDAAAAWEFDQWLRGGGMAELKKRCKTQIKSVRIEQ